MFKIKTKLSYNCLEAMCDLHTIVFDTHATSPQEYHSSKEYRAKLNIVNKVFESLKVKLVKKSKTSKPFNVSYEYHEAYYLMTFLRANIQYFKHEYYQSIIYLYATEIDQQL